MKQPLMILCIALLATVLSSPVIAGEAPAGASQDANVTVVHIGYSAEYAYCTNQPLACNQTDCDTEGRDWCTDNDHDDGNTAPTQHFNLSGTSGNCTVTCADGYMVIIVEMCTTNVICPEDQHLRKAIVTAPPPDNRIWIQFNAPGQDERRLVIYDPRDHKPAKVELGTD